MAKLPQQQKTNFARAIGTTLGLAAICAGGLGYIVSQWRLAEQGSVRPFQSQGRWIQAASDTPAYTACLRRELFLPGEVKHAWIAIAAKDAFELLVNRSPVGKHYLWRPTRPFQSGLSERGQKLTPAPAMAMNFPREYQWADSGTTQLPVFIDITRLLKTGKNVLGLEIESRSAPAMALVDGLVTLHSGETISLISSSQWKGEVVPPGLSTLHWGARGYDASRWQAAELAAPAAKRQWQTFSSEVFTQPFQGEWLRHPEQDSSQAAWFGQSWNFAKRPLRGWLRLLVNRPVDVFVNGVRLQTHVSSRNSTDAGQWILGTRRGQDPVSSPEVLDTDEIGSLFAGQRFELPNGSTEDDAQKNSPNALQSLLDKTSFEKEARQQTAPSWSVMGERLRTAVPERVTPKSLTRDATTSGYAGYDVSRLLRAGKNTIAVRLSEPATADAPSWAPRLALDGGAIRSDSTTVSLATGAAWKTWLQAGDAFAFDRLPAISTGPALRPGNRLPYLQYLGAVSNPAQATQTFSSCAQWSLWGIVIAVLVILLGSGITVLLFDEQRRFRHNAACMSRWICGVLLPPVCVIVATLLVRTAWVERAEILWYMQPLVWRSSLALTLVIAWLTAIVTLLSRVGSRTSTSWSAKISLAFQRAPDTLLWKVSIVWLLLLAGLLRIYALDFQPLDDDEYASTQAILSIAQTGVPSFVPEGVFYTRSPLYHYFLGFVVWLFGENLWSLRLPSALFGVATGWLAYLFGSRLMGRPWVGLGALLLLSLHPYEVFTGHVARFYQAQQFFALLTIYFFIQGFVTRQSQKYRYATLVAFLAAVLCQEITAALGVQLAFGYFLFAKDLGWRANFKLIVLAVFVLCMIALDFIVFQTRCLTRVEGVSPSLEATVKPHLWHVYNFFSLYIGYSRLHLVLSCFLLLGLPIIWKERQRATLALNFMLIAGVVLMNLLVTHVSLRYQYWLIPLWILLSLDALRALVQRLSALAFDKRLDQGQNTWVPTCCGLILVSSVVLSWSPWKMIDSHETKLLGDSTGAMQWVRQHRLPADKIMATEPHTHAGVIELGQIDYDLSVPLLYDFVLLKDGKLIDRNGGAEAVTSLSQLQRICRQDERVWILLNREKFRTRGKNIRWQYPGARIELFLRKNCQLAHRTYLWSVYLWDANAGKLEVFRSDGV